MCVFYACVYDKSGSYIFIDMYISFYIYPKLYNKTHSILVNLLHVGAFQSKSIKNILTVGQLGLIAD